MLGSRSLGGKVALVTGGGSGIGAACARALAEEGARVLVVDYDSEAAAAIAGEVGGAAFAADVTDPDACLAMVAAALEAFGRLDVAVNNAGVGPAGLIPTADISIDDWRRVLATDLDGVFYSMRAEIPALLRTGGGSIVNMSSAIAVVGRAGAAAYAASKHGVLA